jgi:hypothetical protein
MLRSLAPALAFLVLGSISLRAQSVSFCSGDGTNPFPCPCQNVATTARGCNNSAGTGGALLAFTGNVSPDTIVFTASGEVQSSLSILYQADSRIGGANFGDGVNCLAGTIRALYVKHAASGINSFPEAGDLSISARSAALGDTIPHPGFRYYQVAYRDKNPTFCAAPLGGTWNVTNAVMLTW